MPQEKKDASYWTSEKIQGAWLGAAPLMILGMFVAYLARTAGRLLKRVFRPGKKPDGS